MEILEETNVFPEIVPPFVALNSHVSLTLLLSLTLGTAGCSG